MILCNLKINSGIGGGLGLPEFEQVNMESEWNRRIGEQRDHMIFG